MKFNEDYQSLPSKYIREITEKKQIVLGNLYFSDIQSFFNSMNNNGGVVKCPHFSIDKDGTIYKHFDKKYYSTYLDGDVDEYVITIGLYNMGLLFQHGNKHFDIYNNSYNGEIFNRAWKNCTTWQPYTKEQYQAAIDLCTYLLEETDIPKEVIPINVHKQEINNFKGVCYRSNHHIKHYDLNPSWDFSDFKIAIENG